MHKTLDVLFPYRGYHGCFSKCRIRVYEEKGKPPVVIATELEENPGTSVTNRVEHIATQLYQLLERPEQGLVFIEHYQDRALIGGRPTLKASFDRVRFTHTRCQGFIAPEWHPLTKAAVEQLIGAPLDP